MTATTAEPTTTPDLLGITLGHRAMGRAARRLAELAARIRSGEDRVDRRRATALASWIRRLSTEIHHHHEAEDDVLWPVLERCAGDRVDLAALTDDHAALDPLLARVVEAADAADWPALATGLETLADLLEEHITEEEKDLFPIILAHVPREDWRSVETAVRERGGDLGFVLPRIAAVATPEQFAALRREAGPVLMALLVVTRFRLRRTERLVFGEATL